ncbi:PTS lactose/cellobiose transporter subunit IIA [Alkalibacterium kapii]|uniref:Lichenan-specific phosphotransferase enzyme IIA component n=1 Tax=Alkalibacterium kapii TaxID=426704 RepID=A0A511AV83_9LACT|nr:PTS lactose/cellobiose transporter subunit IIA [Alkalibacterium kapii]GEK92110.1 lichenan-specific phosphotransferase enzyme IIA component [Alkalibacterium kapii]
MSKPGEEIMEVVMTLIMYGGDARSSAMEAIAAARNNDFERAQKKLDGSVEAINKAHEIQTELLAKEADGQKVEVTLLLVHAGDHVMNAMTYHDLAEEITELYKRIN